MNQTEGEPIREGKKLAATPTKRALAGKGRGRWLKRGGILILLAGGAWAGFRYWSRPSSAEVEYPDILLPLSGLINSDGESQRRSDLDAAVRTADISGRKALQRLSKEGVELLNAIQDDFLDKAITVACDRFDLRKTLCHRATDIL